MKKKWLYRRRSIENDIRLAISEWLIRFACSLRERESGSLEWLQMLSKEQQPKDYDTIRKTDDLELGLFENAYFKYSLTPHKNMRNYFSWVGLLEGFCP